MAELKRRLLNLAIALDQFLWCLLTLGNSDPDMTLSAAAWRAELRFKRWGKIARPAIDFLFRPLESNHCHESYLSEITKKHLPGDMRG